MSDYTEQELIHLVKLMKNPGSKAPLPEKMGDRAGITIKFGARDDSFVTKRYGETLSGLQSRENSLLFNLRQLKADLPQQGLVGVATRVATMHEAIAGETRLNGEFEIKIRWYGFDLLDWASKLKPIGQDGNCLFQNAEFLLALTRSSLRSLQLQHLTNHLHCDVKSDNFCQPATDWAFSNGKVRGSINPDDLKAIDLGITLNLPVARLEDVPQLGCRENPQGQIVPVTPHPQNHARRLVQAYVTANAGRGTVDGFKKLDWRIDLWALGVMIEDLIRIARSPQNGVSGDLYGGQAKTSALGGIAAELKSYEEQYRPNEIKWPPEDPHSRLIQSIDEVIGPDDKKWAFELRNKSFEWGCSKFKIFAAIAALILVPAGWIAYSYWQTTPVTITDGGGEQPLQPKSQITTTDDLFTTLASVATDPARQVTLQANQTRYVDGEAMKFTVTSPVDGYLTLMQSDAGVAWPSELKSNYAVRTGQTLTLTGSTQYTDWRAAPPYGNSRILALVTPTAVSLTASGVAPTSLGHYAASRVLTVEVVGQK